MDQINEYTDLVSNYYNSSERPYKFVGIPDIAFAEFLPETVLKNSSRLILIGEAGTGKTTFLDWTAAYAAQGELFVPIFISLRNYGSNLIDLINVSINRYDSNIYFADLVKAKSISQEFVFLFDGFDEVPSLFNEELEFAITKMAQSYPSASFILTSRILPKFLNWEIKKIPVLTQEQIFRYLSQTNNGEELWSKLIQDKRLLDLASRPVFLYTIRKAWEENINFREYLMDEIPLYTAWRGHTKSALNINVKPSLINDILGLLAYHVASGNKRDFSLNELNIIIRNATDISTHTLAAAIFATDVIITEGGDKFSFSHKSFLESYAAKFLYASLLARDNFLQNINSILASQYAKNVLQYLLRILDEAEIDILEESVGQQVFEVIMKLGENVTNIQTRELSVLPSSKSLQIIEAIYNTREFLINQRSSRRDILVLSVHGFNTRGDWKNKLGLILTQATDGERFLYRAWDYGKFRAGIFLPWARNKQVEKFHIFYNDLINQFPVQPEVCIVAHSFGTYIVGHALRRFPEIKFERVLFLGSALPRKFKWTSVGRRIDKMLNLIGASDIPLLWARVIPGIGDAGRQGFTVSEPWINQKVEEFSDHSDLFGEEYMRSTWLPFFRDGIIPL